VWFFLTNRFGETAHQTRPFSSEVSKMRSAPSPTKPTTFSRPYVCKYCGRRFFNSYGLSLHYNSQWVMSFFSILTLEMTESVCSTRTKPFICNFCGRGFTSPSGKSHHRVHMHGYRVPRRYNPTVDGLPGAEYTGNGWL